jgi:hypothetical protein
MNDRTDKALDVAALLDRWPGAAPPAGFSRRVLDALDAPPRRARSRSTLLLCAALAAFAVALPLLFLSGVRGGAAGPPLASIEGADLGIHRD